jgi:hypothetical protein
MLKITKELGEGKTMAEQQLSMKVDAAKFVQIAISSAVHSAGQSRGPIARDILALDEQGDVWLYDFGTSRRKPGWERLAILRKKPRSPRSVT